MFFSLPLQEPRVVSGNLDNHLRLVIAIMSDDYDSCFCEWLYCIVQSELQFRSAPRRQSRNNLSLDWFWSVMTSRRQSRNNLSLDWSWSVMQCTRVRTHIDLISSAVYIHTFQCKSLLTDLRTYLQLDSIVSSCASAVDTKMNQNISHASFSQKN